MTTPATVAKAVMQRRQAKEEAGPEPRFPRKLHTDAQILAAVKWAIRALAREEIAPDTARALVDALEKLMKLKRQVQSFDMRDEDRELLELAEKRMVGIPERG